MPDVSMSGISFEITGSAKEAQSAIKRLTDKLVRMNATLNSVNVANFTKNMGRLISASMRLENALGQTANYTKEMSRSMNAVAAPAKAAAAGIQASATAAATAADGFKNVTESAATSASNVTGVAEAAADSAKNFENAADEGRNAAQAQTELSTTAKQSASALSDVSATVSTAEKQIRKVGPSTRTASAAMNGLAAEAKKAGKAFEASVGGGISKFISSLKRIALYRFVRTVIKEVTDAIKEGITNVYEYDKAVGGTFSQAMDRARAATEQWKNSLGAMLAPLLEALIPLFIRVVNWVIRLNNAIGSLIARLLGKSSYTAAKEISDDWKAVGGAAEGAGKQAKEAMKYLAPFDELNRLPGDNGGSGGGGGGGGGADGFETRNVEPFEVREIKLPVVWGDLPPFNYPTLDTVPVPVEYEYEPFKIPEPEPSVVIAEVPAPDVVFNPNTVKEQLTVIADPIPVPNPVVAQTPDVVLSKTKLSKTVDVNVSAKVAPNPLTAISPAVNLSADAITKAMTVNVIGAAAPNPMTVNSPVVNLSADAIKKAMTVNVVAAAAPNPLKVTLPKVNLSKTEVTKALTVKVLAAAAPNPLTVALPEVSLSEDIIKLALSIKPVLSLALDGAKTFKEYIQTFFTNKAKNLVANINVPVKVTPETSVKGTAKSLVQTIADAYTEKINSIKTKPQATVDVKITPAVVVEEKKKKSVVKSVADAVNNAIADNNIDLQVYMGSLTVKPNEATKKVEFNATLTKWITGALTSALSAAMGATAITGLLEQLGFSGAMAGAYSAGFAGSVDNDWQAIIDNHPLGAKVTPTWTKEENYEDKEGFFSKAVTAKWSHQKYASPQAEQNILTKNVTANWYKQKYASPQAEQNILNKNVTANWTDQSFGSKWVDSIGMTALFNDRNYAPSFNTWLGVNALFYGTNYAPTFNSWLGVNALFYGTNYAPTFNDWLGVNALFYGKDYAPSFDKNIAMTASISNIWQLAQAMADAFRIKIQAAWNAILGKANGGVYTGGSWRPITSYASGGYPRGSQLFVAREAGPELVGTLGGHTAVMNNDQIVASVSAGVARAISSIRFHMDGFTSAAVPTYAEDEDTEEVMYRATMRALEAMGLTGEAIQNIRAHISSGEVYESVRTSNRANTRMTGINALA